MKITQEELKTIIREELQKVLSEDQMDESMRGLALGALMSLFGQQALAADGQPPAQSDKVAQQVAQQQPDAFQKFKGDFSHSVYTAFEKALGKGFFKNYQIHLVTDKDGNSVHPSIVITGLQRSSIGDTPKRGNDIYGSYDKIENEFKTSMKSRGGYEVGFGETKGSDPGTIKIPVKSLKYIR